MALCLLACLPAAAAELDGGQGPSPAPTIQEPSPRPSASDKTTSKSPPLYEEGAHTINPHVGIYGDVSKPRTIVVVGVGNEHFVTRRLSLSEEAVLYLVEQHAAGTQDSFGVGVNLLARWYAVMGKSAQTALFVEAGIGVVQFNRATPVPDSTSFNFTEHIGLGARFLVSDDVTILVESRVMHLSNAGLSKNNPGITGLGGFLEVGVRL